MLEIKQRALLLLLDNPNMYSSLYAVQAAMSIGASIVLERGGPDPVPGENEDGLEQIVGLLSSEQELADEDRWRSEGGRIDEDEWRNVRARRIDRE